MINYAIYIGSKKPGTKKTEQGYATVALGTAQIHDKLDFDDFCQHIADHNSPFSKGTTKGVLTDAVECIREQLLAGNSVSLGDLGTFHVELACEPAVTTEDFLASNIKEVNVRWTPGKRFQYFPCILWDKITKKLPHLQEMKEKSWALYKKNISVRG
ncbi:MAG: HU family DNA-binding protein [Bacteroidaceae bacterium]|nr:HU family DNA-binding protein [Bacteroidaceae bacterium]